MSDTAVDGAPLAPWRALLLLEWRLTLRDFFPASGRRRRKAATAVVAKPPRGRTRTVVVFVVVQALLHAVALSVLLLPKTWTDSAAARLAVLGFVGGIATFMLSYTMTRVITAFHERRDLDLLLSAPVRPALVLAVRAGSIVVATTATFGAFVFPFADVAVASGRWWMARVYPFLPLTALLVTGIALASTDLVVRAVGLRRARVALQLFSGLVGASMYLVGQARNFLPASTAAALKDWSVRLARLDDAPWPVTALARLAGGDPLAWLVFAAVSVGVFAATVRQARDRFVEVAQTPEADSRAVVASRDAVGARVARGFDRGPFATLLVKEWRLILRSPQLISQVFLQMLYLMPLLFAALSKGTGRMSWSAAALAAAIVGVAGTLATSLAWLAISGEDAPDLLAGSPCRRGTIVAAKVVAGTAPPVLLVAIAALGLARATPVDASIVFAYGLLACTGAAIGSAAQPVPGKRSDFQRRYQGRPLAGLVEMLQFVLWAAAAGTAVAGHGWISAGLAALALVAPTWRLRAALRTFRDDER